MARRNTVVGKLSRNEVLARDGQFFLIGIAGELNNFHTVSQCRRDRIKQVSRANKENVGEIKGNIQIVITECMILFGIQHFEQRGGRIATKISSNLIYFIKDENRIV